MTITVNVFGAEFVSKRAITLEPVSASLRDILLTLQKQTEGPWSRMMKDSLRPVEGCVILVNGRNIRSLENLETEIHDGDEITFTVLVSGG